MEPNDFKFSAGTSSTPAGVHEKLSMSGILVRSSSIFEADGKLPIGAPGRRGQAVGFWFGGSGYDGGGGGDGADGPNGPSSPDGDTADGDSDGDGDGDGGDGDGGDGGDK